MDGPGPSSQANAAARALRAARRATGEAGPSAQQSQSASFPQRDPGAGDESSDDDDDDDDEEGEDKPPVYHHEIWEKLLRKGSRGGLLKYVNQQPEAGTDPLDITAVDSSQITWDMTDRRFWPNNLTLWKRPEPWTNPDYEVGVMKYKGRVVLDCNDKPIRNFRNLPLTISSKVEGLRLEAWLRADNRLSFLDIEARLWTETNKKGKREPKFGARALSKRPSNARMRAGLISWQPKKGRDKQTDFMDNLRTDAQRLRNLAIDRDLTSAEKARYSLLGLNEDKKSKAPTRQQRINKMRRLAEGEDEDARPSSAAEAPDPVAGGDNGEVEQGSRVQEPEDDTEDDLSVSSSLLDPQDSRHDQPMNPEEEASLRDALRNTVEHFSSLTGQAPVLTHPGDNYFSQWGMLQEQLRILWVAGGNAIGAPRLRARDRWTGGISQYHLAEVIEVAEGGDESESSQEEDA